MMHRYSRVLITDGAGFIGSHLVDRLMKESYNVMVLDNLSSGSLRNVEPWLGNEGFRSFRGDLTKQRMVEMALENVDLVFHFAANPEVRVGENEPTIHFEENLVATFNFLEAVKKEKSIRVIIFASTSTVYANVVGPGAMTGVIVDFIQKLNADSNYLEILGDGSQKKSYLYVDDCIDAISCTTNEFLNSDERIDVYNVGSYDHATLTRIAEIVVEEMARAHGGRGWRGDVKTMLLSIQKLLKIGWKPRYNSENAVRMAVKRFGEEP